MINEDSNIHD